jgi:hypothetical protein
MLDGMSEGEEKCGKFSVKKREMEAAEMQKGEA